MFGDTSSKIRIIQPIDSRDAESVETEYKLIRGLSGRDDILLCGVPVKSWNDDLSPWRAEAVTGREGFGGGGQETLDRILDTVIPRLDAGYGADAEYYLGGYSLAGLFALWTSYRTDRFSGVAAVSPSVWYPGWEQFFFGHNTRAKKVYLSLGDKEENTKNKIMSKVGDAIRKQYRIISSMDGIKCALEWNEGNHFREPELRTAKGFAWLIKDE